MRADSILTASSRVARLVVAGLALAVLAGDAAAQPAAVIEVFDHDFGIAATLQHVDPTITVGQTVRWHWVQGLHSVTSVQGIAESWDAGDQDVGFEFDHTFTHVGSFAYYCDIHGFDAGGGVAGGMSGIVHVSAPEPSATLLGGVAGCAVIGLRRARCRLVCGAATDPEQDEHGEDAVGR